MQALRAPAQRGRSVRTLAEHRFEESACRMAIGGVMCSCLRSDARCFRAQHWRHRPTGGKASPATAHLITPDGAARSKDRQRAVQSARSRSTICGPIRPRGAATRCSRRCRSRSTAIRTSSIAAAGRSCRSGRMMREGDDDDRVPILRKRLRISGDLVTRTSSYNSSYTYDEELADAVARFQRRNGLRPTGRIERSTYPAST